MFPSRAMSYFRLMKEEQVSRCGEGDIDFIPSVFRCVCENIFAPATGENNRARPLEEKLWLKVGVLLFVFRQTLTVAL